MKQNNFGELIYTEDDVCDLIMKGYTATDLAGLITDSSVELKYLAEVLDSVPEWHNEPTRTIDPAEFHAQQQATWHMPTQYKNMDIAAHVLSLCNNEAELQRCGKELLLYQERGLFDLLRFMVYMVDVMTEHNIVWGVGRGSSVASYVLFKLKVHRIDSIYYNLDVEEFLR
jgi:DNA polymerase III alpha subunit